MGWVGHPSWLLPTARRAEFQVCACALWPGVLIWAFVVKCAGNTQAVGDSPVGLVGAGGHQLPEEPAG